MNKMCYSNVKSIEVTHDLVHCQYLISVVLKLFIITVSQSASITCSCFCSFIHFPSSFISGIMLLGTPTEIYVYGTQYIYIVFGLITMGFIMASAYLPVFHSLQLTSAYEVNQTLFYHKQYDKYPEFQDIEIRTDH